MKRSMGKYAPAVLLRGSFLFVLLATAPALAAPAHCEAELSPGRFLISATFDDEGRDKAMLLKQWTEHAVAQKASAASARCSGGSAEVLIEDAYGSIFVKTEWTPK